MAAANPNDPTFDLAASFRHRRPCPNPTKFAARPQSAVSLTGASFGAIARDVDKDDRIPNTVPSGPGVDEVEAEEGVDQQDGERLEREALQGQTVTVPLPVLTIPPGVLPGVYANHLQELVTDRETYLDCSFVYPAEYRQVEGGQLGDLRVENTLVARIILPSGIMETFVRNYIQARPQLMENLRQSMEGDA